MVDNFNNDTGLPGKDGKSDDLASNYAKQKMRLNGQQPSPSPSPSQTNPGVVQITGDPLNGDIAGITSGVDANGNQVFYDSNGNVIQAGKKDDSFPVRLGTDPMANTFFQGPNNAEPVPYNTLRKDGFLGVTDQGVIDRVRLASGGDVKLFDKVYLAAVDKAALLQKTGKDVTVYDVLDQWKKGGLPSSVDSGNGGSGGPYSSTNRVVSLSDEGTARRLLNGALTNYLGRTASDEENAMFLKALNVQERRNATVTKTVGNTSGRNTTQSQTVTGGMDKNDFADRFAKSQEGYAEYQAATTYLDAFIGSLKDDARVVG